MSKHRIPRARSLRDRLALDADDVNGTKQATTDSTDDNRQREAASTNDVQQAERSAPHTKTADGNPMSPEAVANVERHTNAYGDNRNQKAAPGDADGGRLRYAASGDLLDITPRQTPKYEELNRRATFWLSNEVLDDLDAFSAQTGISKAQIVERGIWLFMKLYREK